MYRFLFFFLFLCNIQFTFGQSNILLQQIDSHDQLELQRAGNIRMKGGKHLLRINNQSQFDSLNEIISNAICAGYENIVVKLAKGIYRVKRNHLSRINEIYPDVAICIKGEGAVITAGLNNQQG